MGLHAVNLLMFYDVVSIQTYANVRVLEWMLMRLHKQTHIALQNIVLGHCALQQVLSFHLLEKWSIPTSKTVMNKISVSSPL